jgi:hypothetical protein
VAKVPAPTIAIRASTFTPAAPVVTSPAVTG